MSIESLTAAQAEIVHIYHEAVADGLIPEGAPLVGGGAMVMYDMKGATPDIDVVTSREAYALLARRPDAHINYYGADRGLRFFIRTAPTVTHDDYGAGYTTRGRQMRLDVLPPPSDKLYAASYAELAGSVVIIAGIPVLSPTRLLAWKEALTREKDKRDAQLIAEWLRQHLLVGQRD